MQSRLKFLRLLTKLRTIKMESLVFDKSLFSLHEPEIMSLPMNPYVGDEELNTDEYQSIARNRLIVEAFYLTGDIEKYGSGYIRVREEIKEYPTILFEYKESVNGYWEVLDDN